jgi:hypothetical protein
MLCLVGEKRVFVMSIFLECESRMEKDSRKFLPHAAPDLFDSDQRLRGIFQKN